MCLLDRCNWGFVGFDNSYYIVFIYGTDLWGKRLSFSNCNSYNNRIKYIFSSHKEGNFVIHIIHSSRVLGCQSQRKFIGVVGEAILGAPGSRSKRKKAIHFSY